jgi:hypothetical protein
LGFALGLFLKRGGVGFCCAGFFSLRYTSVALIFSHYLFSLYFNNQSGLLQLVFQAQVFFVIRITIILTSCRDHFDKEVEESLRRSLPIITTHAKSHLANKPGNEAFTDVYELDAFQSMMVDIMPGSQGLKAVSESLGGSRVPAMKVTAMPGKHVPPGVLNTLNELVKAVRPECLTFPPSFKSRN